MKKKPRKTTAVSRNSRLVFPPDPPSSRLPSPSYNTTTRYARTRVVYFCDPSNSEWDIELLQLRVLCLATFILTIAMWNSTKKEVSVPNFLSLYAAAATPWKKKTNAWSSARLSTRRYKDDSFTKAAEFYFCVLFVFFYSTSFSPDIALNSKVSNKFDQVDQSLMDIFPAVSTE